MTYYKILQYLKSHGLTDGQAHYVRGMIRELVNEEKDGYGEWLVDASDFLRGAAYDNSVR